MEKGSTGQLVNGGSAGKYPLKHVCMCVDVYDCGRVDGSVFTLLCSWEKFSQNLVERWRHHEP